MRVLLVSSVTRDSRTGVTAHYNRLVEHLSARVDSVVLLTPEDTPWLVKKCCGLLRRVAALGGANARVLYFELESFVSMWASVRKYRFGGSFDVVHAQDVNAGAAAALGLARKIPVVVTCHFNDDPLTEYKRTRRLSAWTHTRLLDWYRYLFKQPTAFIPVSDYIKGTSSFLRPPAAACEVIHNGVVFPNAPERTETDFTLVNVGTLEERKNQRLLIDAIGELRDQGVTDCKVWLLGDGPKRQEWQHLVTQNNLQDLVFFLGHQTDVPHFLQSASLYVHTAVNESWGYSITEAIAAGIPVLALATGGIPEQFGQRPIGLLPVSATASDLARTIMDFRDAGKRERLAREQLIFARTNFDLNAMIGKHVAFYHTVANGSVPVESSLTLVEA